MLRNNLWNNKVKKLLIYSKLKILYFNIKTLIIKNIFKNNILENIYVSL